MAKSAKQNETLVGLFVFLGLVLLGSLVLLFGNARDWFKERYEVKVYFEEATGVIKGSTVRFRGTKIGQVGEAPTLTSQGKVLVVLAIEDEFRIPQGSVFQIGQASLLGDKQILITPPDERTDETIAQDAEIEGAGASGLDQLQNEASLIAKETRLLMQQARAGLESVQVAVDEIRVVAVKLGDGMDRVNQGVLSEENIKALGDALAGFEKANQSVSDLTLRIDPALETIRGAFAEVKIAAQGIQSAVDGVEPALQNMPEVLASIEKATDEASKAIQGVQQGEGALGALAYDRETKEDVQTFIKNLKRNGILRYRDEEIKEEDPRDRFRGRRR